jgi:hypothetical protein
MGFRSRLALATMLMMLGPAVASAELVATMTLDGLSFVSFQDEEVLPIPSGSTIRFRFSDSLKSGSIPFTIGQDDVSIAPISLPDGRSLRYALAEPAAGTVSKNGEAWVLQFNATVSATLEENGRSRTLTYSMPFTTETVKASNLPDTRKVEVTGSRVVEGAWYTQVVGATANKSEAYPKPGSAVYTVLSGHFDAFPVKP